MKKRRLGLKITVSDPTFPEARVLTYADVWGTTDETSMNRISKGMVVATSGEVCPVWGDTVPYKSVTVICAEAQITEVSYWLEYGHGANCIVKRKILSDRRCALRSDYKCW